MFLPDKLPGGMGELILSRDVMSRLGFCPLRLAARRQSPVFDLQSDNIIHSEKGPLEAALTMGTDTIEDYVSSEVNNEWQGDSLHYTPITAIQNHNDDEAQNRRGESGWMSRGYGKNIGRFLMWMWIRYQ